jgi:hypothetical protein
MPRPGGRSNGSPHARKSARRSGVRARDRRVGAAEGPSSFFGPDTGSGLVASDIQLYAAGSLVKLTRESESNVHICAPDSKMRMSQGGTHVGVYVAGYIRTEEVLLDVGSPSGAFPADPR